MSDQKIYAFICTRSKDLTPITKKYLSYLVLCGIEVKLLVNQKSIFSGYEKAFNKINPDPDDIIILSHDDLDIKMQYTAFKSTLIKGVRSTTGFVGVAGTTYLGEDVVWWDHAKWQQGLHRGSVHHVEDNKLDTHTTFYGAHGPVVVLDGLFLATKAKVLKEIGLAKPEYLKGDWDFYDIHYTLSAHTLGYQNITAPLKIVHYSRGELAGRDSWHENKQLVYEKYKEDFPIVC